MIVTPATCTHHLRKPGLRVAINLIVGATIDNVGAPGLVVVAAAVLRTAHLAVACIEVAAVAESKAVRLVWTQVDA